MSAPLFVFFTENTLGKTGLEVKIDVIRRNRSTGAFIFLTSGTLMSELGDGIYVYDVPDPVDLLTYDYPAVYKATGTALDARQMLGGWTDYTLAQTLKINNLDATISSRLAAAGYTVPPTVGAIADSVWDELLPSHTVSGSASVILQTDASTDPLSSAVPGTYPSGSAGDALGKIGTGRIYTQSIVAQSGAVETVQGDNYLVANGRRIEWTDANNSWPDLTTATIKVIVGGVVEFSGTVINASGVNKKVGLELTSAQSLSIPANTRPGHDFQVRATIVGGAVATLVATNKPGNENAKWMSVEKLELGS